MQPWTLTEEETVEMMMMACKVAEFYAAKWAEAMGLYYSGDHQIFWEQVRALELMGLHQVAERLKALVFNHL
jgi:hypothetical protein